MKAADIPDETILSIVREFNEGKHPKTVTAFGMTLDIGPRWALIWDLQERLPDFPEKVIRAKCKGLIKRGLLDGCSCGCRGDFELPEYAYHGPDQIDAAIRSASV